jgi:hypothetical protein
MRQYHQNFRIRRSAVKKKTHTHTLEKHKYNACLIQVFGIDNKGEILRGNIKEGDNVSISLDNKGGIKISNT